MPIYPYCVVSDVEGFNQHRPAYTTGTKPTLVQVTEFVCEVASRVWSSLTAGGYDTDNIHQVSTTVALALAAGSNKTAVVASASGWAIGDKVKLQGTASGVLKWEYCNLITISGTTFTLDTVVNAYDAGTLTLYLCNHSMRILRTLNALGAAAMAEENTFMGVSPNKSEHAEILWARFNGSKETRDGLWAIENIPGYLPDADQTTEATGDIRPSSYGSEHSTDADVEPVMTKGYEF